MAKPPSLRPRGLPCPECEISCVPLNCGPVVVDRCPKCGGIWFDDREIGAFREKLRELDLTQLVPRHAAMGEVPSLLGCPRCQGLVMEPFVYGVNTNVKPLRCGRCRGIWLTGVELQNFLLMARLSQEIAPDVAGLALALRQQNREADRWKQLGNLGDDLNQGWSSPIAQFLKWLTRQ